MTGRRSGVRGRDICILGAGLAALLVWRIAGIGGRRTAEPPPVPSGRVAMAASPGVEAAGPAEPASSPHRLSMPVAGADPRSLRDSFNEKRGGGPHGALDILAPRGTPVLAVDDGVVRKLFTSVPGGLTVYQFDADGRYCYYYAHLDAYAPGLHEGQRLRKGDLVAFVGTTGNAPKDTPHLHFAVSRLDQDRRWWTGTPIDPYPLLVRAP